MLNSFNFPSFVLGFLFGMAFLWLMGKVRPLFKQIRENMK